MKEKWDVYSKDKKLLNKTIENSDEFLLNEYHLGVIALIINSEGKVLMTKRSMTKTLFPGKWEFVQGGVLAGESSIEGILREVKEEIAVTFSHADTKTSPVYSYIDGKSILDVWLFNKDVIIEETKLQEIEVDDIHYYSKAELFNLRDTNQTAFKLDFIDKLIEENIIEIK